MVQWIQYARIDTLIKVMTCLVTLDLALLYYSYIFLISKHRLANCWRVVLVQCSHCLCVCLGWVCLCMWVCGGMKIHSPRTRRVPVVQGLPLKGRYPEVGYNNEAIVSLKWRARCGLGRGRRMKKDRIVTHGFWVNVSGLGFRSGVCHLRDNSAASLHGRVTRLCPRVRSCELLSPSDFFFVVFCEDEIYLMIAHSPVYHTHRNEACTVSICRRHQVWYWNMI